MQITQPLHQLLERPMPASVLQKGSTARNQVRALQALLYGLGFGKELNWDKFLADADYGGGTTAAVKEFLRRNGLAGDGTVVEPATLERMLALYQLLPALRQLRNALETKTFGTLYTIGSAAWPSLEQLAAAAATPQLSLAAFSEAEATQLLAQLSSRCGDDWAKALHEAEAAQRKAEGDIQKLRTGGFNVATPWTRVRFNKFGTKPGVYTVGSEKPSPFIENNRELLMAGGLTESAIRVLLPVSHNEGNLDAINTWDNCFLTYGMFQWTLGTSGGAGELPALLRQVKEDDPEAFEEYYGRFGLDVAPGTTRTSGFVTLDGRLMNTAAKKETFRAGIDWAFRFWRSGLDARIQAVQVRKALDRINSFRSHPDYRPLGRFHIGDLITSEYGMCLILDHHVNRPGHLMNFAIGKMDILGKALKNAGLTEKDPANWTTADEQNLLKAYLPLRAASSMTHGKDRAERIRAESARGRLSIERGSFDMPAAETRSRSLADPAEEYPRVNTREYYVKAKE